MSSDAAAQAHAIVAARAHGRAAQDEPIAPLTSYRLGGPAAVFLEAETHDDLVALSDAIRDTGLPLLVLGRGSNMLVSDEGFPGIAVRLGGGFRRARVEGDRLDAGAAMPVPALAALAAGASLSGFEFAVAIPASFGGAIAMNAGAHGRTMAEVVIQATVFDTASGAAGVIPADAMGFAYRSTHLPPGSIVTGGVVGLAPGDPDRIAEGMREARDWRRATQPIGLPNAGSVFKNPPQEAAGSLIERVCGKGMEVGRARVSEVHANFIVTQPGARSAEVFSLIRRIQRQVKDNTGVVLETEVKLIGEFGEGPE